MSPISETPTISSLLSNAEERSALLREVRAMLQQDPEFATWLEGLLAEKFPRRDEFARLLDELQAHRQETKSEFARIDQRFEQVDQRFEQVDQRFEQVDQRFEQVDQRFEQVDQRFEQVDQRFEQVDQRFEQVDQRFDTIDQRFDRIETELEAHRGEFARLETAMQTGFQTLERQIDRLGARWGIRNEKLFRSTMRSILESSFGATVQEVQIAGEQYDCLIVNDEHILVEITASVGRNILSRLQHKRQLYIDTTGITPARFILAVGSIYSKRAEALRAAGFDVIEPEEDEVEEA